MNSNQLRIAFVVVASMAGGVALAEDGVTNKAIVFGQVAALTGPAQDLGQGMRQGVLAAFEDANRGGGISGRTLALKSRDDGYEPEKTVEATKAILDEDKVFALIGAVGTPTSKASQPIATEAKVPFIGPFTGAEFLRNPYNRYVVNVAMAAEEIAQSVEQISTQAARSAHIARQASDETKAIIATVEQLVASVGQINNVSNLIRDVAAQTNLLALNATIEAARAGDAGRGFAVVAQEVKSLAGQTEKATGDITQQISSIEVTTSQVVQAMKAIAGTIAQLDENASDISVAVQQQDAVSKEIARSANAAAERTRDVSMSVVQVSDAAAKTDQVASAVLNAGGELAARSGRLRAEVERFLAQVRVA